MFVVLVDNGKNVTDALTVSSLRGISVTDPSPSSPTTSQTNPITVSPFSVVRVDY